MAPYIEAVDSQQSSYFIIKCFCNILRIRWESSRSRTKERSLLMMDKLVHYYVQSHIQINEYRDCVVLPSASKTHGRHINTCIKILDMTGLKLSALSQIKLLTSISSIDDQNYPEMTKTYYIVNAPYIFSACWKVVKPLLQERTRKKVQVLSGCGQDELLKIMITIHSRTSVENKLYDYIKKQASLLEPAAPLT